MLSIVTLAILTASISNVSATIGTGQLFVYTDATRTILAPNDGNTYNVTIGFTYYFRIMHITEFNTGDKLTIKIGWKDVFDVSHTTYLYNIEVLETSGHKYVDFTWTIPIEAKISTTGTVHYRGDSGPDYLAKGETRPVAHIHFIPETPLGTIGPILALVGGLIAFPTFKKRLFTRRPA